MDEDQTRAEPEATYDEVAAAVDDTLSLSLGDRRMPVSWLLVVDVLHEDGSQYPVVFERPESSWVEVLGLMEAGGLIVRGAFVDDGRGGDDDG